MNLLDEVEWLLVGECRWVGAAVLLLVGSEVDGCDGSRRRGVEQQGYDRGYAHVHGLVHFE